MQAPAFRNGPRFEQDAWRNALLTTHLPRARKFTAPPNVRERPRERRVRDLRRMKVVLRRWSGFVLILCWLATSTYGQVGQKIQKIDVRHVGPPAASESLIRANIRVKEGDTYVRTSVDDDVRSLFSTGFFYNIRVATEPAEGADG